MDSDLTNLGVIACKHRSLQLELALYQDLVKRLNPYGT